MLLFNLDTGCPDSHYGEVKSGGGKKRRPKKAKKAKKSKKNNKKSRKTRRR